MAQFAGFFDFFQQEKNGLLRQKTSDGSALINDQSRSFAPAANSRLKLEEKVILFSMSRSPHDDWYKWLVEQSRTDHIYDLIHGYLNPNLIFNHEGHVTIAIKKDLPEHLLPLPEEHLPQHAHEFFNDDYLLLHNDHLTEYLEAARALKITFDQAGNNFIELLFHYPEEAQYKPDETLEDISTPYPSPSQATLRKAWQAIVYGNKSTALEYAMRGRAMMNEEMEKMAKNDAVAYMKKALHYAYGYHIIATAYLLNDRFEKAFELENSFLKWGITSEEMAEQMKSYLVLLMVKKQSGHLHEIFEDAAFKRKFLAHYEAYISLLVNPHYRLTKKREVISIINLVNHHQRQNLIAPPVHPPAELSSAYLALYETLLPELEELQSEVQRTQEKLITALREQPLYKLDLLNNNPESLWVLACNIKRNNKWLRSGQKAYVVNMHWGSNIQAIVYARPKGKGRWAQGVVPDSLLYRCRPEVIYDKGLLQKINEDHNVTHSGIFIRLLSGYLPLYTGDFHVMTPGLIEDNFEKVKNPSFPHLMLQNKFSDAAELLLESQNITPFVSMEKHEELKNYLTGALQQQMEQLLLRAKTMQEQSRELEKLLHGTEPVVKHDPYFGLKDMIREELLSLYSFLYLKIQLR